MGDFSNNGLLDDIAIPNSTSGLLTVLISQAVLSCLADLNADGVVDAADLAELLSSWGPCGECATDFDQDGNVDAADLAELLAAWGVCS